MKTIIRNSYTPKVGDYCNALVIDKESEKQYFFDADGVWTLLSGAAGDYYTKEQVDAHIGAEAEAREAEDERIWDKIEDIEMSSDVVDVVGTMADLSNYDTSTLSNNDLIKVLQDNTHGDAISYYRWDTATNQFSYVGSEGPYYTQSQTDSLLDEKADYTIFYVPASATGPTRYIYKNADMTGEATVQDLIDANNSGAVVLRLSTAQYPEDYSDSYLQNAFIAVNNSDYEFVFLDDRSTHTYSADETTDSVFDYYKVDLQAKLTAGTNITINGTTISATDTDTTYSAGTGLNLNGTTFSIDNTVALKSEIPTATSQLNNDSGFIDNTVSNLTNYYTKTETYTQGEVNGLINSITVPTKTSDLQNDSGFITASDYASSSVGGTIKVGSGLAIDADGVLSATGGGGGSYTAGTGIDITNDVISVDNTTVPYFSDLSTVATTGSYNDLSDTPTIPAAQVNADWNASSGVAQILNKPTIPTVNNATLTIQENGSQVATFTANASSNVTANIAVPVNTSDLNNDSGFITNTDYADSSTGGVVKVGSGLSIDANGVLSTTGGGGPTYTAGTGIDITSDVISVDNTTVPYFSDLATVATTGDYDDLLNKPTIPAAQVNSDWNANSGVAQILNKPTIPAAQIQSDWTQADNTKLDYIKNKPTIPIVNDATLTITQNGVTAGTFTANSNVGTTVALTDTTYSDFVGTDGTSVGTAGLVPAPAATDAGEYLKADGTWDTPPGVNYTAGTGIDITGTTISVDTSVVAEVSDIPTKTSDLANDGADGTSTYVEADDLATVATSGSYTDLLDAPTIPTVNNATLTIQKNGSQVATFTANASSNVTANIAVPVNTSDLNNDSGFVTATDYADASTGGVVKVGSGLSIDSSGVLSATASGPQRYDATWVTTQQTATQTQYDELRAAILAGDIIYVRENNEEIIATRYGAPTGSVFAYFSFDELYEDQGNVSTTVAAFAVSVDGTTKAITALADTVAIPESVPTKTSDLTNDGDDGVHPFVATDDLATVATSGSYNDLLNKPTIPTVNDATLTITQNGTSAGTFTANASSNTTIALTDTTYSAFTGATSSVAGAAGLVPAPTTSDPDKFLKGDGTWSNVNSGITTTEVYVDADELVSMVSDPANNYFCFYETFNRSDYEFSDPMTYSELTAAFNSGLVYVNVIYGEMEERVQLSSSYRDDDMLDIQRLYGFVTRWSYGGGLSTNDYGLVQWTYIFCSNLNSGSADAGTHFQAERRVNAAQSHLDSMIQAHNAAPTTSTEGVKGQIIEDSSSGKLYVCTDVSNTNPVVYTWEEVGGGTFDVTISTTTGASWTSDKTYAQIVAAITAGTPLNVHVNFPSVLTAAVNSAHYSPSDGEVYFGISYDSGNGVIVETISIDSSDNITATQETVPTTSDIADVIRTTDVGTITTNNIANGAVTSDKIDWSTMPPRQFSTSEQETGYTWVDGRKIYRKVFTGTTNSSNIQNVTHNISNFYTVINVYGYIIASNGESQPVQRVVPDSIGTFGIGIGDISSTRFVFQHPSSNYQGRPYAVILEYIKTS